jgi:hypothetical protein
MSNKRTLITGTPSDAAQALTKLLTELVCHRNLPEGTEVKAGQIHSDVARNSALREDPGLRALTSTTTERCFAGRAHLSMYTDASEQIRVKCYDKGSQTGNR